MEPQARLGLAALTRTAYAGIDLTPLKTLLSAQARDGSTGAMMDLSIIEQLHGNLEGGLEWQARALETCRVYETFRPGGAPLTLLVIAAPIEMGGNTPVEFLTPDGAFRILTYYPSIEATGAVATLLPAHDVAFCAAPADAEIAEQFYDNLRRMTARSKAPVLNLPDNLVKPERDTLPPLYRHVAGLRLPETLRLSRADIISQLSESQGIDGVGGYPLVVRPVGSHAGLGLEKISSDAEMIAYLSNRPEEMFFVGEFMDYASRSDGRFRKYRIVMVDGQAYPCHMAIADQWDVWYMNADMQSSADKRQEEAEFMDSFARDFNRRHKDAFEALAAGIGLDYFGFDCAEGEDGNLVVFELDNALIVHDMDCETVFPYKKPHMRAIFAAFSEMLKRHALPIAEEPGAPIPVHEPVVVALHEGAM